ncbi:hypothetical protein [uncultured Flavonifractor sp.]|uniref:hypothetical protein n=1 Tax=uncultured Flavonifractor sp. TaxID=1193534 RepID=UPI002595B89E|nr:hypothetical protein [uncultured Flavonifractor sp.]
MNNMEKLVQEKIEEAIVQKDAALLGKIIAIAESIVEEGAISEGPLYDPIYDTQAAIGSAETCREMAKLLAKHGLKGPAVDQAEDFEDLETGFYPDLEESEAERFYAAVMEFLLGHEEESGFSEKNAEAYAGAILAFAMEDFGQEGLEEFAERLSL